MSVKIIKSKGLIPLGLIGFAVVVLLHIFYRRKKSKLQVFLIINTDTNRFMHVVRSFSRVRHRRCIWVVCWPPLTNHTNLKTKNNIYFYRTLLRFAITFIVFVAEQLFLMWKVVFRIAGLHCRVIIMRFYWTSPYL